MISGNVENAKKILKQKEKIMDLGINMVDAVQEVLI